MEKGHINHWPQGKRGIPTIYLRRKNVIPTTQTWGKGPSQSMASVEKGNPTCWPQEKRATSTIGIRGKGPRQLVALGGKGPSQLLSQGIRAIPTTRILGKGPPNPCPQGQRGILTHIISLGESSFPNLGLQAGEGRGVLPHYPHSMSRKPKNSESKKSRDIFCY